MKPVAQTTRSAGSTVPSASSAFGPSLGEQPLDHLVAADADRAVGDPFEEPLGRQADRVLDDVLHPAARHQVVAREPELPHRHRPDGVQHRAPQPVSGAVQELLEAAQPPVAEQRLAHPGQQQHLEVEHPGDLARDLPQQLPGDDVGALGDFGERHGDVAGRLAVADDEHVLAARFLDVVEVRAGQQPPARRLELRPAGVLRQRGLAEHAVRDDHAVDHRGPLRPGGHRPPRAFGDHRLDRGPQPQVRGDAVRVGVGRRGTPGSGRRRAIPGTPAASGSPRTSTAPWGSAWSARGSAGSCSTPRRRPASCRRPRPRGRPAAAPWPW